MRQDRVDCWLGPILFMLAIVWSWMVVDTIPAAREAGEAGPRAFPLMMGMALGGLALVLTVGAWRARGRPDDSSPTIARATARELRTVGLTFGLLIAYGFLMEKIGFLLATPLVVFLAIRGILGIRAWLVNGALALGLTAACFVIFIVAMEAPLPRGTWFRIY